MRATLGSSFVDDGESGSGGSGRRTNMHFVTSELDLILPVEMSVLVHAFVSPMEAKFALVEHLLFIYVLMVSSMLGGEVLLDRDCSTLRGLPCDGHMLCRRHCRVQVQAHGCGASVGLLVLAVVNNSLGVKSVLYLFFKSVMYLFGIVVKVKSVMYLFDFKGCQ